MLNLCYIPVVERLDIIFNRFYAVHPRGYRIWWNDAK